MNVNWPVAVVWGSMLAFGVGFWIAAGVVAWRWAT